MQVKESNAKIEKFSSSIFSYIDKGDFIDILDIETQADFCDWINENDLLNGGNFQILFDSIVFNKKIDIKMFCICNMDLTGDVAKVKSITNPNSSFNKDMLSYKISFENILIPPEERKHNEQGTYQWN